MDVDNPLIYEFHFRDERGQNKIFVTKRGALKILCWTDWRQNLPFKKVWPHYFPSLCLMCVLFYLPWIEEAVCGGKPVSTGPAAWRVVCTEWVAQDWEMADGRCLPKFNFPPSLHLGKSSHSGLLWGSWSTGLFLHQDLHLCWPLTTYGAESSLLFMISVNATFLVNIVKGSPWCAFSRPSLLIAMTQFIIIHVGLAPLCVSC